MAKYMPRCGHTVHYPGATDSYKVREVNYLDGTVVVELADGTKQKVSYRDLERVE
jgi:DNA repair exonuclease SbcCD nuclease subunit